MSNNPNIYYGTATVTAGGKKKRLTGVIFRPSGIEYEEVDNGKGFVPVEVGAYLKGKQYLASGDIIKDESNVTVTFKANTGQTWMMNNATRLKIPEVNKDGFDIQYSAAESEEMSNG